MLSFSYQGVTGDAAVAESVLDAPNEADGHDNDSKCPEPEAQSSNVQNVVEKGACSLQGRLLAVLAARSLAPTQSPFVPIHRSHDATNYF